MTDSARSQRRRSASQGADLAQLPARRGQPAQRGPRAARLPASPTGRRAGRPARRDRAPPRAAAAGRGARDDPQQGGAAGRGGGERPRVVQAGRQREHAVDRHQAVGRLEPDDAAVGGRDADRAAGVGADRQLADARGDQGGRTAGGAARGPATGRAGCGCRRPRGGRSRLRTPGTARWRTPRRPRRAAGRPAPRPRRRGASPVAGLPHRVGSPSTAMMSLTATGRPARGPAADRRGAPATETTALSGRPSRSSALVGGEQVQVRPGSRSASPASIAAISSAVRRIRKPCSGPRIAPASVFRWRTVRSR